MQSLGTIFRLAIIVSTLFLNSTNPGVAKMELTIGNIKLPEDFSPISMEKTSSFSGVWAGKWDNVLTTIMAIEEISDDGNAQVLYAIGSTPQRKGGWVRYKAKIEGDTLTMFGKRHIVVFQKSSTGRIRATLGDGFGFGILSQHDPKTFLSPNAEIRWTDGNSLFLETDLVEDNKPARLESVIYRPKGKGPFPLAIINHGSTGAGIDPKQMKETWENAWLADFLNERGWLVAFPQRRGRGQSDGLYDEGFAANRSEGYTCDPVRSLAGADRALEDIEAAVEALRKHPDVATGPVLVGGNSRGGILSIAYAGLHPDETAGAINFVGGWMGDACEKADQINQTLFVKGSQFPHQSLWFYGEDDLFYTMDHSRKNFETFQASGGRGKFLEKSVRGENNGHWVIVIPTLWQSELHQYLENL